ncbi:MAG: hypothetical protein HY777_03025 [Betaproteobacteria bacterium]|nr:hypothetical protein [Betaproteobacteria bacterium]
MSDGWFEGLPYPLLDMRPQGFLGRNFAYLFWQSLEVSGNLNGWTDDDALHMLAIRGHDQSGDLILGERAYQRHLDGRRDWESRLIAANRVALAYHRYGAQHDLSARRPHHPGGRPFRP